MLFVFVQDHKIYIQVGYGLEGALPDALAKRIIENEITPHFRNGDFDGGLRAGVTAMLAATKGEYKGTGQTVADQSRSNQSGGSDWVIGFFPRGHGSWSSSGGFSVTAVRRHCVFERRAGWSATRC